MALRNDLSAQVKADLTGFSSAIDGQAYILLGENTMGDRTCRVYYYQASSTTTPDGDNVIDATAMASVGRFHKINIEEFNPTNTSQITEVTNLYYTDARARNSVSLTTVGTSGAATYNSSTGVLNIPQYINSGGTVTSIGLSSTDFSVSNSPITSSGNITANLATTGISAGAYGIINVDSKGRATSGKRQETYSGTTNASGVLTVTYGSAYGTTPNVQFNFTTSNPRDVIMLTASSTTGCTVQVQRRTDVVGLLPTYTNQNGISIDILVTEK